jgi:hypothetical protein
MLNGLNLLLNLQIYVCWLPELKEQLPVELPHISLRWGLRQVSQINCSVAIPSDLSTNATPAA